MKRRNEIIKRMGEIRSLLEGDEQLTDERMTELETEIRSLEAELAQIDRRAQIAAGISNGTVEGRSAHVNPVIGNVPGAGDPEGEPAEQRTARDLPEYRSGYFKKLMGLNITDAESRALAAVDVPGVIPTETENNIIRRAKKIAPLLDYITLLRVPGNVTITVEDEVEEAELHSENAAASSTDDGTFAVHLGGYELFKLTRISKSVKAMSVPVFIDWIEDVVARGVVLKAERYIAAGTGVNQPQGIAYARTWTNGTTGRAWAGEALADVDLTAGIALLPARHDAEAVFCMSKRTFWMNVEPIRDDSKAPIIKEISSGKYAIHGYPVLISDKFPNGVIYLGNLKMIYGNLAEGITVASSEHSGFASNSIDYRGTAIFDCKVADPEAFVKIAASL